VALWVKEGWQWILNQALGIPAEKPCWLNVPVMRRIAITTPNVMVALRRLNRDKARPYNFALSPVLVNLSNTSITLLGPFEKDSSLWGDMPYINIHDGTTYTLNLLPPLINVGTDVRNGLLSVLPASRVQEPRIRWHFLQGGHRRIVKAISRYSDQFSANRQGNRARLGAGRGD
jgi:hypothetical protein